MKKPISSFYLPFLFLYNVMFFSLFILTLSSSFHCYHFFLLLFFRSSFLGLFHVWCFSIQPNYVRVNWQARWDICWTARSSGRFSIYFFLGFYPPALLVIQPALQKIMCYTNQVNIFINNPRPEVNSYKTYTFLKDHWNVTQLPVICGVFKNNFYFVIFGMLLMLYELSLQIGGSMYL